MSDGKQKEGMGGQGESGGGKGSPQYGWFRQAALLTGIPMVLLAGPACGYAVGSFIDRQFAFGPWGMIFFTIMGGIAGVRETVKLIKRTSQDE